MPNVQVTTTPPATSVEDEVVVRIPADPRHLRIVRMVAATFASDAGYSIDEVDDVRMAADEVCASVLEQTVTGPVTVTLRRRQGHLSMQAEAPADSDTAPALDELRAAILGAVADDFSSSATGGRVVAAFTKAGAAAT